MPRDDDQGLLDLAEAIEGLRTELTRSVDTGDAQRARMRFRVTEPVVLEVQAVTTKDANGKVGWKIIEVGGSYTAENTHKLTVSLSPEWWDDKQGAYTADFLISATLPAPVETAARADAPSRAVTQGGVEPVARNGDDAGPADDRLDEDDA